MGDKINEIVSLTPPRTPEFRRASTDTDLFVDENCPPPFAQTQPSSTVTEMSSAPLTQKDLAGFYNQITEKFTDALKTISQSQINREPDFAPAANSNSAAAFLPAWTPLNLKANQTILLQRLTYIWDASGQDPTTSTTNIGLLLDEDQQTAIQNAIMSIKTTGPTDRLTNGKWINAILSIYGPKPHSILKQLIDPQPFKDET